MMLLISCSSKKGNNISYIDITKAIDKEILLSDIAEDIHYVALSNEMLIGDIVSVELSDSLIFLSPASETLYVFDRDGKLKSRIGKRGKGPGEYNYSNNFTIDKNKRTIYILNTISKNILKYSFEGKFLGELSLQNLNTFFNEIILSNNYLFLFEGINGGYGKYDWVKIDTNGDIISKKLNYIKEFPSYHQCCGNKQVAYNNTLYYWNQINDTIFEISNEKHSPAFMFAQGDFRFPKQKVGEFPMRYFFPRVIFITKKYVLLGYGYQYQSFTALYEKSKKQLYVINKTDNMELWRGPGIVNDFDSGLPLIPLSYYRNEKDEEFIVSKVDPFQLKSLVASEVFKNSTSRYPEKKKELEKLALGLKENDNPILMITKLKD